MKKTTSTTTHSQDSPTPAWSFWLWLTAAFSAVLIIAVIGTAWAVRHAVLGGSLLSGTQSRIVMALAEFPVLTRTAVRQLRLSFTDDPILLLMDRKTVEQPHWVRRFPAPEDPGYLLFSGVDPAAKRSVVKLIRISDGVPVAQWEPDWKAIYEKITVKKFAPRASPNTAYAVHPLLLADGDIVFNTAMTLVRLSTCSPKPVWVLDEIFHHSIELDPSGDIWAPSITQDGFPDNPWLRNRIRDDALARVSADGRLLDRRSFARILRDNGLQALLMGTSKVLYNEDPIHDPIHMNQIQVSHRDSKHWKQGDLLISSRHLSTVFLYRPSTGRILWHMTGPWMNQHSADFVDDHRISVFDNNIVAGPPKEHAFMAPGDTNRVLLYDFDSRQVTQPFAALLAEAKPVTITAGRARVLPDGGLFVEETEYGRHLRFTRDRLLWSRVNDYDDRRIGAVVWSRYLTADEVRGPLQALSTRRCSASTQ